MPLLQLRFENNGTTHEDLILYFGDHRLVEDSYYLSLDKTQPDDESPEKTARVLVQLLEQWQVCVENTADGETRFLPYGFSDQSTTWLRCAFDKGMVELQPGSSDKEGWSIAPSQIMPHVESVPDFHPLDGVDSVRVARGLFEMEITVSIGDAQTGIDSGRYQATSPAKISDKEQTLDQLQIGERAIVVNVTGDTQHIANARNSGLTNGTEFVLVQFTDSGKKIQVEIAGQSKSLDRDSANAVVVKRIS